MNQQKIKLIENEIQQIKNLLTNWEKTTDIYHSQLEELTNQLQEIKKQANMNKKNNSLRGSKQK